MAELTFKVLSALPLVAVWDGGYLLGRIRPSLEGEYRFDASSASRTMTAEDLRAVAAKIDELNAKA